MKKIEKEYNKRFSDQQIPNGDFDVDGLWDAVSNNLDVVAPMTATSAAAVWSAKWIWALVFSGILGTAFAAYFFISKNEIASTQIERIAAKENRITDVEKSKNIHSANVDSRSDARTDSYTSTRNETSQNTVDANDIRNNFKSIRETNTKSEIKDQKSTNETKMEIIKADVPPIQKNISGLGFGGEKSVKSAHSNLSLSNSLGKENQNKIHLRNSSAQLDELVNDKEKAIGVQARLLPSLSTLLLDDKLGNPLPRLAVAGHDIEVDKPKRLSWQFSLLGGVNNFLFTYSTAEPSALAAKKNESETGQWGYQLGLQTGLVLHKHWVISSGLRYQNLYSRFDLVRQTNTQIFKEDEIKKVWLDSNTGDVLNSIVGDTLVDAIRTRTVVHHNRYQQFSVPLDFGFQKTHRSFIYGLQAGVGFHFVSSQSGKTLDLDGEIIDFDADSSYTPFRSFHIGFRLSPLAGYSLSNQWALTLQPQWAWNPQIGFDHPNLNLTTQQFNLILGLRYTL